MLGISCFGCQKVSELQSLRAAVKRFEDGREVKNITADRDKAVRQLEKAKKENADLRQQNTQLRSENRTLSMRLEDTELKYERLLKAYEYCQTALAGQERFDDCIIIIERVVDDLNAALSAEKAENEKLRGQLMKLKSQTTKDNTNSSKPSSQVPNHKTPPNSRPATDRKPGGQKGHEGHGRKKLRPTEVISLPAPEEVINNPDYYATGKKIIKQLIRVSVHLEVIQYEADEYRSHTTRKKVHAAFPEDLVNDVEYDASVDALVSLLHSHGNMSYDKIMEVLSDLTDGQLSPSKGWLASLEKKFSAASEEDRQKIWCRMLEHHYMHIDGTMIRVNGKNRNVLIETSPAGTLLFYREHKGFKGVEDTPAEVYDGTMVHDGESTFFNYGQDHQGCLVHEERYLKGSMDNETHLTWASYMREFIQHMIHYVKEAKQDGRNELTPWEIEMLEAQYDAILDLADQEYTLHPPNMKYYPEGFNTMKRLRKHRNDYLHFLHDLSIPYHNNPAEQVARKEKMHSKQSGGYRSPESAQYHCDVLSVMESNRVMGIGRYDTLLEVYKRH